MLPRSCRTPRFSGPLSPSCRCSPSRRLATVDASGPGEVQPQPPLSPHHQDSEVSSAESSTGGKARFSPEVLLGKNKIGWVELPDELLSRIDTELEGGNRKQLKRDVGRIHDSLRSTGSASNLVKYATATQRVPLIERHTIQYGPLETSAYVASRIVPAYAAAWNVMSQIARRCPDFDPKSCLDFATGPGTALWAANGLWKNIDSNIGVDLSEPMLAAAGRLAADSCIRGFATRRYLSPTDPTPPIDLVIASFAFEDLASDVARQTAVETLWSRTKDILVLIDRGTPEGSSRIAAARAQILSAEQKIEEASPEAKPQGVHIVGPCPHALECPMLSQSSWCHFSQRIQRSKTMMAHSPENLSKNHQDIKFSYVVLRRGPLPSQSRMPAVSEAFHWPRIVAPPMKRDKHVVLDYCGQSGQLERIVVSKGKGGKAMYHEARKSAWGDIWPHKPVGTVVVKAPNTPTFKKST